MKSWTKSLFAGGLLWIIIAGGAAGDQFGDGWAALTRHDYATAMRLLRPLAEAGNAEAQFGVAILYNDGLGVRKDHLQGARWYLKSADQGYSGAQYDLGVMYDLGQGVPQDYVRAYMWLDLAASISRPGIPPSCGQPSSVGRPLALPDLSR